MTTDIELRARAAYEAIAQRLARANDEIANITADLAVARASINELQAKVLALETPKPAEG